MTLDRGRPGSTRAGVAVLIALIWCVLFPAPAFGHSPASTLITVSLATPSSATTAAHVRIDSLVSLQELDLAYGSTLAAQAAAAGAQSTVTTHADDLASLYLQRVTLTSGRGDPWSITVESVDAGLDQDQAAAHVVLLATAPAGARAAAEQEAAATLTWGVVTDEVVTHTAYVGGLDEQGNTVLIAKLTRAAPSTPLTIKDPGTGTAGSPWQFSLGFDHFRAGADHLLFLALVALGVARRRGPWRAVLRRLALLTLVFSLGHSLSLALAAGGVASVPLGWVEICIAVTVLLAAVHAVRPSLTLRAEGLVVLGFGFIHGFGFAGTLQELRFAGLDLVLPVLSFNLGLEVAQVGALLLALGPLLVIARSARASTIVAGAWALVAGSWIVERVGGTSTWLQPAQDVVLGSPERLALALAVVAIALVVSDRVRRGPRRAADEAPRQPASADPALPTALAADLVSSDDR